MWIKYIYQIISYIIIQLIHKFKNYILSISCLFNIETYSYSVILVHSSYDCCNLSMITCGFIEDYPLGWDSRKKNEDEDGAVVGLDRRKGKGEIGFLQKKIVFI